MDGKAPAATGQRGNASRAQPHTRVAHGKIFLFGFAVTIEKPRIGQGNPRKSKPFFLDSFDFPWSYLTVTRPKIALSPADEGHLGHHDGHGEHVGRERQVGHMRDRFADLAHVRGRLGRDAAVGVAHPKGLLAAPFRRR
jgi:hypothetical protein